MSAENAPGGEATSSSEATDKDFSCIECGRDYASTSGVRYHMRSCCPERMVECPECNELYVNHRGMRTHASRMHGLNLSVVTSECSNCTEEFEHRSHIERKYCSRKCLGEARADYYAEKRIDVECIYCGEVVALPPALADRQKYCSESCRSKDLTERGVMKPNPEKEYISFDCAYCGEEYEVVPAESDNTRFCSKSCQGKWRTGSRNPNWRGGRVDNYGPNWSEQRDKVLERDGHECQVCGVESSDLDRDLSVHHIQPLRSFKEKFDEPDWWRRGNRLDNLVSLCISCHHKWEGIPLRPT